jgi:hypothetical protein
MKKLITILGLTLVSLISYSQLNVTYVRSYDSTLAITNNVFPDDTLFKFTNTGELVKYSGGVPVDTFALKSEVPEVVFDVYPDSIETDRKLTSKLFIGQLYTDDGTVTISTTVSDTYYTITGLEDTGTWSISENLTLTDSTITIPSDGYGYYDIYSGWSYMHSVGNTICHASVFVQRGGVGADVEITANETQRKIGSGGDTGDAGRVCSVLLGAGDVLKAKMKADNTGTITIENGTFKVVRIN